MSMMPQLIDIVKLAAPAVATALGSPIAGIALSLISNAFGVKGDDQGALIHAIQSDPEADFKLKALEYNHAEELKKLDSADYKTSVVDRIDARRNSSQYQNFIKIMAVLVTVGFFTTLYMCFMTEKSIADPEKQILLVFVGVLTSKWQTIIDFFYGSSNK